MKIKVSLSRIRSKLAAFSLVEVTVGLGIIGTVVGAMLSGIMTGTFTMRMARENLRATQILEERMEVLRLIKWDDVNTPGFIPTNFVAPFYPPDSTNATAIGIAYTGTVSVINAPIPESYANNLRAIQINLTWTSGSITRTRQMTSYVSRYGLQNYVY